MTTLTAEQIRKRIIENTTINEETGCWEWNLYRNKKNGYGLIWAGYNQNGKYKWSTPHRLSYMAFNGPIPIGMEIAHACHCRHCCNPAHLIATDHQTNAQMSVDAGRTLRGESKPNAKLDETIVRIIKEGSIFMYLSHSEAARVFGIAVKTLRDVLYGRTWTHVSVCGRLWHRSWSAMVWQSVTCQRSLDMPL